MSVTIESDVLMKEPEIVIFDLSGRKMKSISDHGDCYSMNIHLEDLKKGPYLLNLRYGNRNVTRKIVLN